MVIAYFLSVREPEEIQEHTIHWCLELERASCVDFRPDGFNRLEVQSMSSIDLTPTVQPALEYRMKKAQNKTAIPEQRQDSRTKSGSGTGSRRVSLCGENAMGGNNDFQTCQHLCYTPRSGREREQGRRGCDGQSVLPSEPLLPRPASRWARRHWTICVASSRSLDSYLQNSKLHCRNTRSRRPEWQKSVWPMAISTRWASFRNRYLAKRNWREWIRASFCGGQGKMFTEARMQLLESQVKFELAKLKALRRLQDRPSCQISWEINVVKTTNAQTTYESRGECSRVWRRWTKLWLATAYFGWYGIVLHAVGVCPWRLWYTGTPEGVCTTRWTLQLLDFCYDYKLGES